MKNNESGSPEKDHIEEMLDENEMNETDEAEKPGTGNVQETNETTVLAEKLKEAEDKLLRQAADADNYRKRLIRDTDERIKYANQSILEKFLPVLDNFDLALRHTEGVNIETVIEGIRLNGKVMLETIEKAGMTKIKVEAGEPFNPAEHEAITLCSNENMPDNAVALVIQNGYRMADRVVRPAKVQVNKFNK
ncbi:MAG: nucleotide exchange factor GrpE [Deferribacteraceae bacterium]|nr:nucleotide exchange factor GrpE [Deferribacteraceae bacterium]